MELRSINTKKVLNLSPALVNKVIKTTLSNSKRKIITKKDTSFFNFLRIKILESGQQLEQEAYQIKIFKIIPNISEQKIKINKELFFNETINFNI